MNLAADQPEPNPLREGLSARAVPQPCAIVIFGATGDLTHRKLVPALYNLAADGDLPPAVTIVGFARRPKTDDEFRGELEESTRQFSRQPVRDEIWKNFEDSIFYHQSEFEDEAGYKSLAKRLDEIDKNHGTRGNRLFYFAAAPDQFEPILKHLKAAGLNETCKGSWARVIVEKPFGSDLASARELNRIIHNSFSEEQTYRIDHFLGKETAQNILVLRFANAIFAPLWNTHYVDQVQITAAETLGVGTRAGYYEDAGALRDMVQNHLLQLLCLVAMEAPSSMDADAVRDEKLKVLRSLRRINGNEAPKITVRGQYRAGASASGPVNGYIEELENRQSRTETFVAIKAEIANWRWAGVPFYLRTGKRLATRASEIVIEFKQIPHNIFGEGAGNIIANQLVIRLQPDEGVKQWIMIKDPGPGGMRLKHVPLDMSFAGTFDARNPDAYERLIMDVVRGNQTLFMRRDEVEAAWKWIDTIQAAWQDNSQEVQGYTAGTWGPSASIALIERDGRTWHEST